jgi:hypothetical protein
MTHNELAVLKQQMIDLMIQLRGVNYTVGWLGNAYTHPIAKDIERLVVIKTVQQLKDELALRA